MYSFFTLTGMPRQEMNLPFDSQSVIEDLALNTLFNAMADGDPFLFEVARQTILSGLDAPGQILYRQAILQDCLKHPEVVRQIYSIPLQAIEKKDSLWMGAFNRYPSSILSGGLEMLVMFVDMLKSLKQLADQHADQFESEGFQRFLTWSGRSWARRTLLPWRHISRL